MFWVFVYESNSYHKIKSNFNYEDHQHQNIQLIIYSWFVIQFLIILLFSNIFLNSLDLNKGFKLMMFFSFDGFFRTGLSLLRHHFIIYPKVNDLLSCKAKHNRDFLSHLLDIAIIPCESLLGRILQYLLSYERLFLLLHYSFYIPWWDQNQWGK